MVNFDNETTVTIPSYDLLKILILQRRESFIDAYEAYHRVTSKGVRAEFYEARARLRALFYEIQSAIKDSYKEDADFIELKRMIESNDQKDNLTAWYEIEDWLYKKKLTKFDNSPNLGPNIIHRNKMRGWL